MFAFDFIVDAYQKFVLFFMMWNIQETTLHIYHKAKFYVTGYSMAILVESCV